MEPVLDAEVAGHFRHAQAHGALVAAEAFQDEGQLVPHFVGHNLRIGVLHDETDASHLLAFGHIGERHAIEQHLSALVPMGREHRLELAQERCLPTAALPTYQHKLARLDGHRDIAKGIARRFRVAKRQLFESE